MAGIAVVAVIAPVWVIPSNPALGQAGQTPIYTDDSTAAGEGIARARDQLARGNVDEAVEVLRSLLRTEGDRVIVAEDDPGLYYAVRDVINRMLLRHGVLFERYLAAESAEAQRLGDLGLIDEAERIALLTPAGFDAAIRLTQRRMESAQFDAAWLTLRGLEEHPSRRDAGTSAVFAALATQVARYLPADARIRATVTRWRDEAGLAPIEDPGLIPGPELLLGVTPFEPAPEVELSGIVSRPLWSEPLSIETAEDEEAGARLRLPRSRNTSRPWRVFPAVSGDTIYISDGVSVAAWDRFTLSPRWRTPLVASGTNAEGNNPQVAVRRGGRAIDNESAQTVTTSGRWVVASAPESSETLRAGATAVVALDSETGAVRWRTLLWQATPTLEGATIEGRLLIDQGVVVVMVSKNIAERRLESVQLLGLDLATGSPLWRRPLGSTGTLPFASGGSSADLPMVRRGVVYLIDALGFAAAVETVSGRTSWVRDLRIDRNQLAPREPWASMGPVVIGDSVFVVTPDYLRIDEIDAHSGRLISSRGAVQLLGAEQSPLYLLDAGDTLAVVGMTAVYGISPADFADPTIRAFAVMDLGSEAFMGRAVIAGETVIVPTRTGLRSAPMAPSEGREPLLTHLEESGNVLALESQLVVIDDAEVRTYLLWDVAQRVLSDRMRETPADPTPAVTFAELAYRAAKPEQILPAVEQALSSIERAPMVERNRAARGRLFRSLLAMVEPGEGDPQLGMLSSEQIERLIGELGRAAAEPTERVEHLMARGRFFEAEGRIEVAVDSYQRVLDDPALASASLSIAGVSARAQAEATRNLRRVVRRNGPEAYAAYEMEARRMLESIAPGSGPEAYTALAQRYPVSRAGVRAWLESASAYLSRGRPHGAVFALESGLQTAEDALAFDDALLGELAGRLINQLAQTGRVAAASELLERLSRQRRTLVMTDGGSPIDVAMLREDLDRRLAQMDRRPRVGLLGEAPPIQTLDGWSIMTPIIRRIVGAPTDAILLEREGEIGLWAMDDRSGVKLRWSIESDERTALVEFDERSVILTRRAEGGWIYQRYDTNTGDLAWASAPLADLFEIPVAEADRTIPTPLDGARPATEQLVAVDEQSLVVTDRGGRAIGYDKLTGRERWRLARTLDGVVDVSVNAGVVAIVGGRLGGGGIGEIATPSMLVLDNRTGQVQHRIDIETGQANWVRVTDGAEAIVGTTGAVSLYDVFTGRRRWSVGGSSGRHTTEAWVFPGRVVVLNDRGDLRQIETESGQPMALPMETQGRVTASAPILGGAVGDRSAFATTIGIVLFDRRGEPVGLDHRPTTSTIHPAEFGADRFVTISMVASSIDGEVFYYDLQFFSMASIALEQRRAVGLFPTPTRIALLDGRILVTSGPGTVVLDTE
jgi:outer membrane protein assembly factor BamB